MLLLCNLAIREEKSVLPRGHVDLHSESRCRTSLTVCGATRAILASYRRHHHATESFVRRCSCFLHRCSDAIAASLTMLHSCFVAMKGTRHVVTQQQVLRWDFIIACLAKQAHHRHGSDSDRESRPQQCPSCEGVQSQRTGEPPLRFLSFDT